MRNTCRAAIRRTALPLASVLGVVLWPGCGGDADVVKLLTGSAEVGGEVVSTVDGTPITLQDVQRVVGLTELSPREALERLQAQRLLSREAERRGFTDGPESRREVRRALVQAFLAETFESEPVPASAIHERYEAKLSQFKHGELRHAMHVLAKVSAEPDAPEREPARAFLQETIERFGRGDPEAVLSQALALNGKPGVPFEVVAEKLLPTEGNGRYAQSFEEALFSVSAPGPIPRIVETRFGLHAIYLSRIEPAADLSLAEAIPVLRDELLEEQRRAQVDKWLKRRRLVERIEIDEAGVAAIGEWRL